MVLPLGWVWELGGGGGQEKVNLCRVICSTVLYTWMGFLLCGLYIVDCYHYICIHYVNTFVW